MDTLTKDDSGTFLVTTTSGSRYIIEHTDAGNTAVRENATHNLRGDGDVLELNTRTEIQVGASAYIPAGFLGYITTPVTKIERLVD